MRVQIIDCRVVLAMFLLSLLSLVIPKQARAQAEIALYTFGVNTSDGSQTDGRLTFDKAGNLYGTTVSGGSSGAGTVFELSPAPLAGCASGSNAGNGWCETVLYSFCSLANCADGSAPSYAFVTFDSTGNLYSTTADGGAFGDGTVFELSPQPESGCPSGSNPGNGWCETVLHSFQFGADAGSPAGGLVIDSPGNLYGTTYTGANGNASVYEVSPNGSGGWNKEIIYSVNLNTGVGESLGIDAQGSLYGYDGNNNVFKLTFSDGTWTPTNIHTFPASADDGLNPEDSPTLDGSGNVYGTTASGGTKDLGTVWKLTPVTKGKLAGTYEEKILHSFTAAKTGLAPRTGVTLDAAGNLYGTTTFAGVWHAGTVYELAFSGKGYAYQSLWSFDTTDGSEPYAKPILDGAGNIYGTVAGGTNNSGIGAIYELIPSGVATETTLTSSPNPSVDGQTVTFTATVSSGQGTPPDGEIVTFITEDFDGEVLGMAPLSGGTATLQLVPFSTLKINAVYSGDLIYSGSTSNAVNQRVRCVSNCG